MKMFNKKPFILMLIVCFVLSACQSKGESSSGGGTKTFDIGTAGTGGALYPMGVAMAQTINEHEENYKSSAVSTGGSVENIRKLKEGKMGLGISQNEVAYFAYNGEEQYKGEEVDTLRALFGTITSWLLIVVPEDSKIESLNDLKGKKIGVGAPGSGGEVASRKVLDYLGLTYDDIDEQFLSDGEMVEGLKDGALDAMIITNPLKSPTMTDLSTSMKIRVIPIDDDGFYEKFPFYFKTEIPAETYPGQNEPVPTVTTRILMLTTSDGVLDKEDIKNIMETLWTNEEGWIDSHAAVKKDVDKKKALEGVVIPLHPGAVEYYKSEGFEIPDELIPPEMKS